MGGGIVAAGVAGIGGYRLLAPLSDQEGTIAGFIADHVPEVSADDEVVATFAADFIKDSIIPNYRHNFDMHVILLANPFLMPLLGAGQLALQKGFERLIITRFLRSTDVLLREDRSASVTYLGLADPYVAGCSNPLATLG